MVPGFAGAVCSTAASRAASVSVGLVSETSGCLRCIQGKGNLCSAPMTRVSDQWLHQTHRCSGSHLCNHTKRRRPLHPLEDHPDKQALEAQPEHHADVCDTADCNDRSTQHVFLHLRTPSQSHRPPVRHSWCSFQHLRSHALPRPAPQFGYARDDREKVGRPA